jgi:hypothetical protein
MNKNSQNWRNQLKKAKSAIVCERMRTQHGSSSLIVQKFVLSFGTQARLSHFPKVARKGKKGNTAEE